MERWTRRDLLRLSPLLALPVIPAAAWGQVDSPDGDADDAAADLPKRARNLAASRRIWPGQEVAYHHFPKLHGRSRYMVKASMRSGSFLLERILAESQTETRYLAIGGDIDAQVASDFHAALLRGELKPPLKLHLAFIGDEKVGAILRKHIAPVLAEFRIVEAQT